jgi:hypothetical protein
MSEVRISLVISSHLSDISTGALTATDVRNRCNFIKWLLSQFNDVSTWIDVDALWNDFTQTMYFKEEKVAPVEPEPAPVQVEEATRMTPKEAKQYLTNRLKYESELRSVWHEVTDDGVFNKTHLKQFDDETLVDVAEDLKGQFRSEFASELTALKEAIFGK